jgi:large conductance mechanosensitive channel
MAIWNNQVVSGAGHHAKKTLTGFQAFIMRGNVVDLAVGIMIGAAFTAVVNGLVGDIITPLIPLPTGSLATLVWHPPYNPKATVNVGAFINVLITFIILAVVIYFFIVQPMNAFMNHYKPKDSEVPSATRDCPYCLNSVPLMATRCGFCTSPLPPPQQAAPMQSQPVQRS